MGNHKNEFICVLKKDDADFSKYGFEYDNGNWLYYIRTLRIEINTKTKKVHFNQVGMDVMKVVVDLVMDGCIEFIKNEVILKHTVLLTDEEYKLIMEKRKKVDD